jgi:hypothetical protein
VEKSKVASAFKRVYAMLEKHGVFLFDISSENKIRNIIGDNMFGEDREDISYLWFNKQTADGVVMDLTFFVKGRDGRYTRYDEQHIQYAHTEEEIISALYKVGFSRVSSEGHLGQSKDERINFIAIK